MQPPSYWRIASRQFWPILTGIFLLVAGGMLVGGLVTLESEWRYESDSVVTTGRVLNKYSESRGSGRNRRTHYVLRYEYSTEAGYNFETESSVKRALWEQFNEGDAIPIQYLRSQPRSSRVQGDTEKTAGTVLSSLGVAGVLLCGFFFARGIGRVRRTKRLWEEGRRVDGTVDEVKKTNLRVNRVVQWKIRYSYSDYAGRQHHGESEYLPPGEALDWNAGDKCVVLCDKDQPEISLWTGRRPE